MPEAATLPKPERRKGFKPRDVAAVFIKYEARRYAMDISGTRYGSLLAISEAERTGKNGRERQWLCRCDCGVEKVIRMNLLRMGRVASCGAASCTTRGVSNTKHGEGRKGAQTTEFIIWRSMKTRCLNPNSRSFKRYGGRGITICDRWADSYENFLADMGRRPSSAHTLDRKDNDGPYSPDNCRWATAQQQVASKSNRIRVTYAGEEMFLIEAAKLAGVPYRTAVTRYHAGLPFDQRVPRG